MNKRKLIHPSLINLNFFPSKESQNALIHLPLENAINLTKTVLQSLSTFKICNDKNFLTNSYWLFQVASFALTLEYSNPEYNKIISNAEEKFFSSILQNPLRSNPEYINKFIPDSFQSLSILFELKRENVSESHVLNVVSLLDKLISDEVIQRTLSSSSMTECFKVVLGLCDYFLDEFEKQSKSELSPSYKEQCGRISQLIFSLLFKILSISVDNEDIWNLFNDFSPNWLYNADFCHEWINYFKSSFNNFPKPESPKFHLFINLITNANRISQSPNSTILHHCFGIVAQHIMQQGNLNITSQMEKRWTIDDIFAIFSMWPFSPGETHHQAVSQLLLILKKANIDPNSEWFNVLIDFIAKGLRDYQDINPELLPALSHIYCAHPASASALKPQILHFMKKRKKEFSQSATLNANLLSSIVQSYIQNSNDDMGTISVVEELLSYLIDNKSPIKWPIALFLSLSSGCLDTFKKTFKAALREKKKSCEELFAFLIFIPYFAKPFLTEPKLISEILACVKEQNILNSLPVQAAFSRAIVEMSRSVDIFANDQIDKNNLLSLMETWDKDIAAFTTMSMFSKSPPLPNGVAEKCGDGYFQIENGIITFIDKPNSPLKLIIRNSIGTFSFEASEIVEREEGNQVQTQPIEQTEIKIQKPEVYENFAHHFHSFVEQDDLEDFSHPLSFKPYSYNPPKVSRIIQFLANTGLDAPGNPHHLKKIENDATLMNFFSEFDSIPDKDIITIGILHFTPEHAAIPGTKLNTLKYSNFKKALMKETSSLKFIYSTEVENITLVFNETGCDFVNSGFASESGINGEVFIGVEEKENNMYKLDLIKNKGIDLAILEEGPSLVSRKHIGTFIGMLATMIMLKLHPFGKDGLTDGMERRKAALEKIKIPSDEKLVFSVISMLDFGSTVNQSS